ncbi:NIF-domain-containing protein [Auriculariales sp. MPI-PUGE-AT-0066]|nr:NIF-domain-containing protein [Auriculariales sp. MPI-PUGE-AT-0066]
MNSLAYLSRQYDVLASTSTSTTTTNGELAPPSTPTDDKPNYDPARTRLGAGRVGKRTRSWVLGGSTGARGPRSRSSPSLTLSQKPVAPLLPPPPSSSSSHPPQQQLIEVSPVLSVVSELPVVANPDSGMEVELRRWAASRWRRTWIMRTWIALWDALVHAWRLSMRARLVEPLELSSSQSESQLQQHETSSDSDDDLIVTRARPFPKRSKIQPTPLIIRDSDTDASSPSTDTDSMRLTLPQRPVVQAKPSSANTSATLLPAPLANYLLAYTPSSTPPPLLSSGVYTPPLPRLRPGIHLPKTLVLDLDETLIHSTTRPLHATTGGGGLLGFGGRRGKPGGHMVEVVLGGRSTLYHVYKRPFVDYFLRKVSSWYTVVIFTASMQEYADPVIDWLDGGRGILVRRFFRESCTQLPSGSYSKDLSVIEPDLARVALVDNSPASYSINQSNGIPIEGWTHDQSDEALLDLLPFLDSLRFTSDVRRVLSIRGF